MVQILPTRPSFAESFGESFGEAIGNIPEQVGDALAKYQQRKRVEKEQDVLSRYTSGQEISPKELKNLSVPTQLKLAEFESKKQIAAQKKRTGANVKKALLDAGYNEETANLWQDTIENASVGSETQAMRHVTDLLSRTRKGRGETEEQSEKPSIKKIDIPGIEQYDLELDFPEISEPERLTPKELS